MMKITDIAPDSPLFGHVRPGFVLESINGREVLDSIDYQFRITDERVEIRVSDPNGQPHDFQFDEISAEELGLSLDDHKIRFCKNNCIFCFVHQQPQGMRRALYFKDEDYRLSFTHGNFVTLSNTTQADLDRIIEQHLSPLYISVHATDDTLRRCMLKNEKLAEILPSLKYLTDNDITLHTQVVLCPGVNDGEQLAKTVDDLATLYPGVATLAVVPVGLTRYRKNLPGLRNYNSDEAAVVIDYVEARQKQFEKEKETRFVWAADEFYIAAKRPFPPLSHYEVMDQFENGVGMSREFISMFNRRRARLKSIKSDKRVTFLTGHSAHSFFDSEIMPYIKEELSLDITLVPVENRFWGEKVTVSGLLTGQDLLREARQRTDQFDTLVLPPNCLNNDDLFLDNLSLKNFELTLGKRVLVGQYNLAETIREVYQ